MSVSCHTIIIGSFIVLPEKFATYGNNYAIPEQPLAKGVKFV